MSRSGSTCLQFIRFSKEVQKLAYAQLAIRHQLLGILERKSDFVDIEERRRGSFTLIFAYNTVEDDWEVLLNEALVFQETMCDCRIGAWFQLSAVEMRIREV